jgi:hypothetical protein
MFQNGKIQTWSKRAAPKDGAALFPNEQAKCLNYRTEIETAAEVDVV